MTPYRVHVFGQNYERSKQFLLYNYICFYNLTRYYTMTHDLAQTQPFILYTSPTGKVKLEVFINDETLWLTQKMMAELFDVEVPAISKHIANIFASGELNENSAISILETTARDGKVYKTKFYNLDAIIAVGYRVNSKRAELVSLILRSREPGTGESPICVELTGLEPVTYRM